MKHFALYFGILAVATSMIGGLAIKAQQGGNHPFVLVRVSKVEPSGGFWSGQLESYQEFEGIVVRSTTSRFKTGEALDIHVLLVYHPAESFPEILTPGKPQLDPKKVSIGKVVRITATKRCLDADTGELVADPECIHPAE